MSAVVDSDRDVGFPLVIVGPTATGKSALAMEIAETRSGVEILSMDSMQVYRRMDIGTAKPTLQERELVPHHMIDIVDASQSHDLASFIDGARRAVRDIEARGNKTIAVGGTGLYVHALVDQFEIPPRFPDVARELSAESDTQKLYARLLHLDDVAATRINPTNRRRVLRALEVTIGSGQPFSSFGPGVSAFGQTEYRIIGLRAERTLLAERIERRFEAQMDSGFLEEVESLRSDPRGISDTARQALGYRELLEHLDGRTDLESATELAITRTRQFATRQERWFRRDPRIEWIETES